MSSEYVTLDDSKWLEPYIESCRCTKCYSKLLSYRFVNVTTHPSDSFAEVSTPCLVFYDGKRIGGRFYDLWHAEAWVRKCLTVDDNPNAHAETLFRKLK